MGKKVLEVKDLVTTFRIDKKEYEVLRGVSFDIEENETLCMVGESGCGKSVTTLSIMDLLPGNGRVVSGSIKLNGQELTTMSPRERNAVRGKQMGMIFQEPMTALNPLLTIGRQMTEELILHRNMSKKEAYDTAVGYLEKVGIANPADRMKQFPFQLSGGLRQRIMIAMVMAVKPSLLIADEPTTALDVTIQAQILNLIKRLNRELDMTTILITHDLGVVATLCDKVVVMYGGLIMEDGTVEEIFYHPKHPYTMGLIDSIPRVTGGEKQRLKPIPGTPPNLIHPPKGCPFSTRCPYCMNVCMEEMPPYFQEDGHRTMCWLLHEEAPVNPEYVQRKEAMRRADG